MLGSRAMVGTQPRMYGGTSHDEAARYCWESDSTENCAVHVEITT